MPIHHHQCRKCYCTVRIDIQNLTREEEKVFEEGGEVDTIWLDEEICDMCEREEGRRKEDERQNY